MGYLGISIWDSFLGISMLNFVLASLFPLLCMVFACFGYNFVFEPFKPKCMDKRMISETLMINKASKRGP